MKRYIIVVGIVFLATLSLGCVECGRVAEVCDVSEINYTDAYTTEINEVVYNQSFGRTQRYTIITGKPIKIHFSDDSRNDMIVFEDGSVVHVGNAKSVVWRLGKVHNITTCGGWVEVVEYVD